MQPLTKHYFASEPKAAHGLHSLQYVSSHKDLRRGQVHSPNQTWLAGKSHRNGGSHRIHDVYWKIIHLNGSKWLMFQQAMFDHQRLLCVWVVKGKLKPLTNIQGSSMSFMCNVILCFGERNRTFFSCVRMWTTNTQRSRQQLIQKGQHQHIIQNAMAKSQLAISSSNGSGWHCSPENWTVMTCEYSSTQMYSTSVIDIPISTGYRWQIPYSLDWFKGKP